MLWIFSLLLLLIRRIEKDRLWTLCAKIPVWVLPLFCIPLWGAAQILTTPIISVYRFGFYGLSFLIGYFILSHDEIMEELEKLWLSLAIAGTGLGIAEVIVYYGQNYAEAPVRDSVLSIVYAWTASLAMLAGCKRFLNFRNSFTAWMSSKCWPLYIFHYTTLAYAAYFMKGTGIPAAVQYLICTIAAFVGAYLLGEIISRIPVVRFWVLGIRGKKKPKEETHVQG